MLEISFPFKLIVYLRRKNGLFKLPWNYWKKNCINFQPFKRCLTKLCNYSNGVLLYQPQGHTSCSPSVLKTK